MKNNLITKDIDNTLRETFLEYAGYNIQRRAIPDARDGLKWGARQLLYSQMLGGFTYDKPFKKAIKSVGQAMGFCYVHGNASAYGTFIRMAKPFSYRYPLQEANGNYGTLINPDDHSADRYVDLRGSKLAAIVMNDIKKDTITEWEDTYDMEGQFPKVLPSKGIWLGVNGCISIGSGMSCSIPPTNLREVNNTLIKLLDNPALTDEECICMPDFPTGATILNAAETKQSMINGNGAACRIRASVDWDPANRCFIVTEMPYSTFTNTICTELASLMEEDEDCGIADFKDYTGTSPDLRIYLTKKANPDKVLKYLYKMTSLETFFTINMVMLDNGVSPRIFKWKEALQAHLDHEKVVYRRGFEFDLNKIQQRIHIINGLMICTANIEEVVQTIKQAASTNEASLALQSKFVLDSEQAKAVLDMKLSRLAHLEVKKLEDERTKLMEEEERIIKILDSEVLLNEEIKRGLREVADKFGDERRTKILSLSTDDNSDEPIEVKSLQVALTNQNNLFVNEVSSLYTQKRGGVGNKLKMSNNEYITSIQNVETTDEIIFFTQNGNYYHCSAAVLPIGEKTSIYSLLKLKESEMVCALTNINKDTTPPYILFFTKNGLLKKSSLDEYNMTRGNGAKALNLDEGDEIVNIVFTRTENVGVMTERGHFIMISTDDVKPIGRVTRGIKAIKLNDGDYVQSARTIPASTKSIVSISGNGLFKQTPINEFALQSKNTKGVKLQKLSDDDWMADFHPLRDESEILIASTKSRIQLSTKDIPIYSKGAQGIKSIKLNATDNVTRISIY